MFSGNSSYPFPHAVWALPPLTFLLWASGTLIQARWLSTHCVPLTLHLGEGWVSHTLASSCPQTRSRGRPPHQGWYLPVRSSWPISPNSNYTLTHKAFAQIFVSPTTCLRVALLSPCYLLQWLTQSEKVVKICWKKDATDWMFVTHPQFNSWNLIPNVIVSGGGAFGRWWGHEGGAPMMGLVSLQRDPRELPRPFLQVRTQRENPICEPGRGSSPDTESASTLILNLDFQPPEPWEKNVCCLYAMG